MMISQNYLFQWREKYRYYTPGRIECDTLAQAQGSPIPQVFFIKFSSRFFEPLNSQLPLLTHLVLDDRIDIFIFELPPTYVTFLSSYIYV